MVTCSRASSPEARASCNASISGCDVEHRARRVRTAHVDACAVDQQRDRIRSSPAAPLFRDRWHRRADRRPRAVPATLHPRVRRRRRPACPDATSRLPTAKCRSSTSAARCSSSANGTTCASFVPLFTGSTGSASSTSVPGTSTMTLRPAAVAAARSSGPDCTLPRRAPLPSTTIHSRGGADAFRRRRSAGVRLGIPASGRSVAS